MRRKWSDPSFEGLRADPRFLALVNAQPRPRVPVMPVVVPPTYEVAGSSPHKHALNQSGIELMRRASMTGRSPRSRRKSDKWKHERDVQHRLRLLATRGQAPCVRRPATCHREWLRQQPAHDPGRGSPAAPGDPHFYRLVRLAKDLQLFGSGRFGLGMKDEQDWRKSLSRFEQVARSTPRSAARGQPGIRPPGIRRPGWRCRRLRAGARAWLSGTHGHVQPGLLRGSVRRSRQGFQVAGSSGEGRLRDRRVRGSDTDLDALRGDPRYDALLERWDHKMAKQHREVGRIGRWKRRTDTENLGLILGPSALRAGAVSAVITYQN